MPSETPCPFCHMGLRYDLDLGADVLCEECRGTGIVATEPDTDTYQETTDCQGTNVLDRHRDEDFWPAEKKA